MEFHENDQFGFIWHHAFSIGRGSSPSVYWSFPENFHFHKNFSNRAAVRRKNLPLWQNKTSQNCTFRGIFFNPLCLKWADRVQHKGVDGSV